MTLAAFSTSLANSRSRTLWSPSLARVTLILLIAAAAASGVLTTGAETTGRAIADAGDDFARLLRSMALLKAFMAAGVTAAVLWRLASPIGPIWFAAYGIACAAMAAGPGMIWGMAHVGSGALLLHAGLFGAIVLVWRDPAVSARLAVLVAEKRAKLRN